LIEFGGGEGKIEILKIFTDENSIDVGRNITRRRNVGDEGNGKKGEGDGGERRRRRRRRSRRRKEENSRGGQKEEEKQQNPVKKTVYWTRMKRTRTCK